MINHEIFLQQMGLLADRIGRPLAGPTLRAYYDQLSGTLSTEEFVAAATLAFRSWTGEYRNWPSPAQLVELIAPVEKPSLGALEAFEKVLDAVSPKHSKADSIAAIQNLGAAAVRAFRAAGGFRDFLGLLESDVPWLRRRFVEAYESACEGATAERNAQMAIDSAHEKVAGLIASVAAQRSMPAPRDRQIAAGGAR